MTGFKPGSSGIGSDRSANCATWHRDVFMTDISLTDILSTDTFSTGHFFNWTLFQLDTFLTGHFFDGTYFWPVIKWDIFLTSNKMGHIFDHSKKCFFVKFGCCDQIQTTRCPCPQQVLERIGWSSKPTHEPWRGKIAKNYVTQQNDST